MGTNQSQPQPLQQSQSQQQQPQPQQQQQCTELSSSVLAGAVGRGEDVEAQVAPGGKSQQHEQHHPIPHQYQHQQHQHQHQQELTLGYARSVESIPQAGVATYHNFQLQHYEPCNAPSPQQQHPSAVLHANPAGVPVDMGMGVELAPRQLLGQFEVLETLGKGASGKVKKARHVVTGQEVAMKIINKSKAMKKIGKRALLQLRTEIDALKVLRHPNILKLFHVEFNAIYLKKSGLQVPSVVLALELAKCGELFDTLMYSGPFPEPVARPLFRQLLSTLEYCHKRNIFHRDIKLENLLLDDSFQLKIADFGLAAIRANPTDLLMTECGTPSYMAPEMFLNEGYDGGKADVWSAGVVLFMILAGNPPFNQARHGDWWFDVLAVEGDVNKFWRAHLKHAPHIPETAQSFLTAVLVPDPARRPSSTELLAHPWMQGPTLTPGELYQEMRRRREDVLREKEREKANAITASATKQMEALAMAQDLAVSGAESSETTGVGCYKMGPGVGGISGSDDAFVRHQMSLSWSWNPQRLAAQDGDGDPLSPWQSLLLTRTDPVSVGEVIMQERYRIFREGRLDLDKALTNLRADRSHVVLAGADVTWGVMGWTANMLKLGTADLEPRGLQSLDGTEAARRAFIQTRRRDPWVQPAALTAIEEYKALDDGVNPCYVCVRSEYGVFTAVNAAFRRLILEMDAHECAEHCRTNLLHLFASFLHPEDRRELCRASAECLLAKDPPSQITAMLRFNDRPGHFALKFVTFCPLKPPIHGLTVRIEPVAV